MNVNIADMVPGLHQLWQKTRGNKAIRIAILDGPVDLTHQCLSESSLVSLDTPAGTRVRSSHGTFITSLIFSSHASKTPGIAPDCSGVIKQIYHEDTDGKLNSCTQSDICTGINAALDHGVDIINISGGEKLGKSDKINVNLKKALKNCERKGVLVVAATGNDGMENVHVPARYPTVLAVGAVNQQGTPSVFSNWSHSAAGHGIVAPGESIVGAAPGNNWMSSYGTSLSTALVSGVAALLAAVQIANGQQKDLLAIRKLLQRTATTNAGHSDPRLLGGQLNVQAALAQLSGDTPDTGQVQEITEPEVVPSIASQDDENDKFLTINNEHMNDEANVPEDTNVQPAMENVPVQTKAVADTAGASVADPEEEYFNPAKNPGGYPNFMNSQLVNVIGQPSYDFGSKNNLDTFTALMRAWYKDLGDKELKDELTDSPHDQKSMAAFLLYNKDGDFENAFLASQLIWLLNINATPTYSITPHHAAFSDTIYLIMSQFLANNVGIDYQKFSAYLNKKDKAVSLNDVFTDKKDQDDLMRMVLPGYVSGKSKLSNGNKIESVTPVAFGLHNWTLKALLRTDMEESTTKNLRSVLNRLYVTAVNKGQSPEDRALNYSLYNIIELSEILKSAAEQGKQFYNQKVVPSKIMRQNSEIREVQLTFFDSNDTRKAAITYAMQVDVSGVTPIMIGETQSWEAPINITTPH